VPAFFLAFLAALVLGTGARDQLTLAALTVRLGQRPAALLIAAGCALAATLLAMTASLGALTLPAGVRESVLVLALTLAGIELLLARPPRPPREPTASLAAMAIVVFAHQLTDATRLLTFALALASQAPWLTAAGAVLGSCIALGLGWGWPALTTAPRLVWLRRALGAVVVAGAAVALLA
jgi:hypothetical protein